MSLRSGGTALRCVSTTDGDGFILQKVYGVGTFGLAKISVWRIPAKQWPKTIREEAEWVIPAAMPLSGAKRGSSALFGLVLALAGASTIPSAARADGLANVDDARIMENTKTGKDWPSNGLDYSVNRFSPLDQITTANVGKLGLAWSYPLELDPRR